MNNYKCFHCLRKGHTFRNCSEATCSCDCVRELWAFPRNTNMDAMPEYTPHFLHISAEEIPGLLYPYKQISRFMKIRTKEQVMGKVDHRLKEGY